MKCSGADESAGALNFRPCEMTQGNIKPQTERHTVKNKPVTKKDLLIPVSYSLQKHQDEPFLLIDTIIG